MTTEDVTEIIAQFESLKRQRLPDAVKYLSSDSTISWAVRESISSQTDLEKFTPGLFQWLYSCAQLRHQSGDLYTFVLQFTPQLLLVYLHAVYESFKQLKATSEAVLLALVIEDEKERPPPITVPSLSRPSVYHQATTPVFSASLTEAALQRHNQPEGPPPRPTFAGKEITVNNRLLFLETLVEVFKDRMMMFSPSAQAAFCTASIKLVLQGMGVFCGHTQLLELSSQGGCVVDMEQLAEMRRFSVSDGLITALLHGIRICLFQSCHTVAVQALHALRMRAEYELLTNAIQVSHALVRLSKDVQPTELQLEVQKYSTYTQEDGAARCVDMAAVHSTLNGRILHYKLSGTAAVDKGLQPALPGVKVQTLEQSPSIPGQRKISKATPI